MNHPFDSTLTPHSTRWLGQRSAEIFENYNHWVTIIFGFSCGKKKDIFTKVPWNGYGTVMNFIDINIHVYYRPIQSFFWFDCSYRSFEVFSSVLFGFVWVEKFNFWNFQRIRVCFVVFFNSFFRLVNNKVKNFQDCDHFQLVFSHLIWFRGMNPCQLKALKTFLWKQMCKSACSIKTQSSPKLSRASTLPSPLLVDKHLLFHLPIFLPSKQDFILKLFADKNGLRAQMVGKYIFLGHEMIPSLFLAFGRLESYMWRIETTILAWKYSRLKSSLSRVFSVTSMLVTDVGDQMFWWQV